MKSNSSTETTASVARNGKYLTVSLAGESYGVSILKVREIIRMQKITPVPQMPAHVKGVINLRGRVVPVIDLRTKFGLAAHFTDRTCIVVVQVVLAEKAQANLGLIVDAVEEVVNLTATDIASPPDFGSAINRDYVLGMAKVRDSIKTLLDIDRALTRDDQRAVSVAA